MRSLTCLSRHWRELTAALILPAAFFGAAGLPGPARAAAASKATIGTVIKPGGSNVPVLAADSKTRTIWAGVETTGKTDLVAKISETSKHVLAKFPVPHGVNAIAVDQDSGTVWVTSSSSQSVTEITESSSATRKVSLANIDPAPAPLTAIAVDPVTGLVFVFTANGLVIRITEATLAVKVIALSDNVAGNGGAIGVDPARSEVWTAGLGAAAEQTQVLGFNEDGTQLAGPLTLGSPPVVSLAVDPTAGRIWVSDVGSTGGLELTELGEKSAAIVAGPFAGFKQPKAVSADPRTGAVWVADLAARTLTAIIESKGRAGVGGPVATGSFAFSVAADPATGKVFVGGYQIGDERNVGTVTAFTPAPPEFTSPASAWFAAGAKHAETFRVATSGFPAPQFAITGHAPAWLSLSGQTGVLKVAASNGQRPGTKVKITITAQNGGGAPAAQTFTVHLGTAPAFTSAARVSLRAGKPARFTIKASGVPAPELKAGKHLPGGLRFKVTGPGTAMLTGTPFRSEAGHAFRVTITATNPVGRPARQTLTIKVT